MATFNLIIGFLLLFAGRNLFWLCVGMLGFLLGVQCAAHLGITDEVTQLIAAVGLGIIGIFLAIAFEWLAVVVGIGFLGGGYLLMVLFPSSAQPDSFSWLIFVVGGILGMCLMIIAFDMTLILISSLLGANLIVNSFQGTELFHGILFLSSMVVGVLVQYMTLKGASRRTGVEKLT
jgi:hypothetical protein